MMTISWDGRVKTYLSTDFTEILKQRTKVKFITGTLSNFLLKKKHTINGRYRRLEFIQIKSLKQYTLSQSI
jgi:hypothetical protein